jgi:hypothetical protein
MVSARKYSGEISRSESFIIGQFTPHIRVRAASASNWRREMVKVGAPGRQTATGALMAGWGS